MSQWQFWQEERFLVIVSLALCCAGILMQVAIWMSGSAIVLPEGDLARAVSFDLAVGTFMLTTALILPLAPLSSKARRVFRGTVLIFCVYGLVIENVQHARGLDPRFSSYGGVLDLVAGILFGVLTLSIVIGYAYLSYRFFRSASSGKCPSLLKLGIQYGLVTTVMGMVSGVWMSVIQGRMFADSANIIWLHGFAFHGLQAVPLIAWLLVGAEGDQAKTVRLVHVGGGAWSVCIAAIGLQTLFGRSIYTLELLPVLALVAALCWAGTVLIAGFDRWKRPVNLSPHAGG